MTDLNTTIPVPNSPLLRPDGRITEVWWQFFLQLFWRTGGNSGTDPAQVFVGLDVDAPLVLTLPSEQLALETLHAAAHAASEGVASDVLVTAADQAADFLPIMGVPSQDAFPEPMIFPACLCQGARAPESIAVSASPMSYTCTERAALHVAGGAMSALNYVRGTVSLALDVPTTGQLIEMSPGDVLEITYSSAPTLTLIAR